MVQRIADIMNENVSCIDVNASLEQVVQLIRKKGYSHIPVLEDGKLVGTVSKTDLVDRFIRMLDETSGKHYTKMMMKHITVEDLMHKDPITVDRSDDVEYARELLLQGAFHGLIVVNGRAEVQGIVTAYDLLKSLNSVSSE